MVIVRPARQPGVEFVQRLAGPEQAFELVALDARLAEGEELLDDDGPRPHGGEQQPDHHRLDDDVGLKEQLEE